MMKIKLTKGLFALVSEQDFEYLNQFKWQASNESNGKKWYAIRFKTIYGKRTKIRMHREVVRRCLEERPLFGLVPHIPEGFIVDHLDNDGLDNRRENLEATSQRNNMLRTKGWKRKGEKVA